MVHHTGCTVATGTMIARCSVTGVSSVSPVIHHHRVIVCTMVDAAANSRHSR